jgi:hypothetical protein
MSYKKGSTIHGKRMGGGKYSYVLSESPGKNFDPEFKPELTPKEMLKMGVFEGKYMTDTRSEFPLDWFTKAKMVKTGDPPDISLNYFGIKSRQSLQEWKRKKWIIEPDERGWFQWYCRYYLGRRIPEVDVIQIKRWKAFRRHKGQIEKNCRPGDVKCRPRQRQALLQWAYNPLI